MLKLVAALHDTELPPRYDDDIPSVFSDLPAAVRQTREEAKALGLLTVHTGCEYCPEPIECVDIGGDVYTRMPTVSAMAIVASPDGRVTLWEGVAKDDSILSRYRECLGDRAVDLTREGATRQERGRSYDYIRSLHDAPFGLQSVASDLPRYRMGGWMHDRAAGEMIARSHGHSMN